MDTEEYISLTIDLQQLITTQQAWHYFILPKGSTHTTLDLFIDSARFSSSVKDELEILFNKQINLEARPSAVIAKTLGIYYRKALEKGGEKTINFSGYQSDDFLINLISESNSLKSSDIHIETYEDSCRIRLRIDGKLIERYMIRKEDYPSLINKIKIKANLDISEKRLPQDGRINFIDGANRFDIRVSILPTLFGEKIVLRLLSKDSTNIDIRELGFTKEQLETYLEGIKKPHGIILFSGPTGSGKTTTLYATLKILNRENTNILTIEDPIEYTLLGVNQVQLKESIGLTFSSALRTFLRQDPDIIMLGEIRDSDTAQMAIRAALTGHLVLSTIHTNSAWGTVSRLIDMGIPSFLLSSTLNLTAAQRLIRLLCPSCKLESQVSNEMFPKNYKLPRLLNIHFLAAGCEECYYTGYKGRRAIYEIIALDSDLMEKIKKGETDVESHLKQKNIKLLHDSAFEILEQGLTSIEEVYPILMQASL